MPPIQPAKKAAKKAAKKSPGHDVHKIRKDTRRAYEHLGRVQTLLSLQDSSTAERVQQLVQLAQGALEGQQPKEAADLLRATEHLSFGSLRLADAPDESIAETLAAAIREEMDHQREKAKEHGEATSSSASIQSLYRFMADAASKALDGRRYRAALEFSRGAEALTHLDHLVSRTLPGGTASKRLKD